MSGLRGESEDRPRHVDKGLAAANRARPFGRAMRAGTSQCAHSVLVFFYVKKAQPSPEQSSRDVARRKKREEACHDRGGFLPPFGGARERVPFEHERGKQWRRVTFRARRRRAKICAERRAAGHGREMCKLGARARALARVCVQPRNSESVQLRQGPGRAGLNGRGSLWQPLVRAGGHGKPAPCRK